VGVAEEVVVAADDRLVIRRGGTMHGAKLTEGVVVPHFEPRWFAAVFEVLRLLTNGAVGVEFVPFSDPRRPHDRHMMLKPAAIPEHDIGSDDAIRADVAIRADLGGWINDGGGMDGVQSFKFQVLPASTLDVHQRSTTLNISSASETT
jgi:hypothetical protein